MVPSRSSNRGIFIITQGIIISMDTVSSSHDVFHSYCIKPDIRFEIQEKQEKVILVVRAHPLTQLFWVLNSGIILILLFFLNFILPDFFTNPQIVFINIFIFVMVISYIWFNFLNWFFNVGIITDRRVVDIDFYSVIYREMTSAYLEKIEDMTVKSGGFFDTLFNYGNLFVQTAGTEPNIEFIQIPKPDAVKQIISELIPHGH